MPQVQPTNVTSEDSQKQLDVQESMHANVLEKIKGGNVFKSLDLPIGEVADKQGIQKPEEAPAQETEQTQEEQPQEEQNQEETQRESQEDTDEEVIPKSKVQARFDQLTATIKRLEQRVAEKDLPTAPVDDVQKQLDAMSEDALEDSLTQVRLAKEKSRNDDAKLLELVKLERRIEKTIVTAPVKFAQNQVSEFNKAAERLAGSGEIDNNNSQRVLEIAKGIYDRYPKLKSQIDGQAMALELAVEHFKETNKSTAIKTNTQNLQGQLNNLKKKTTLDTKNIKTGGEKVNLDKLRNNALTGSMRDKERFAHNDPRFKIDAMIPDHLKG